MKLSILTRLGWLCLLAGLFVQCHHDDPEPILNLQRQDTLTIAGLRAFATTGLPYRVYITDAGKEGLFVAVPGDESSADNTGTVLVTTTGVRYRRDYTGPANARWFGVTPDSDDITAALQAAVRDVSELFIPDGSYRQRKSVELKSNIAIRANPGKVLIELPNSYVSLIYLFRPQDVPNPLENITIDGLSWKVTSQEDGEFGPLYFNGPTINNLIIQNCSSADETAKDSTNWLSVIVAAGKTATGILVQNNSVRSKRMACEIFNHDNYGIYAGKNITVQNNYFHDCWFGISLSGPLENLTVDKNRIANCSLFGIEIAGASHNVKIRNNTFEGTFDKFLEGSNDGQGTGQNGGTIVGGMEITGNSTVGAVTGAVQIYNGGAATFTNNNFAMTGMLELGHSTNGGTYTNNVIQTSFDKAVICDNVANNTFSGNKLSNKTSPGNHATFMSYGAKATNNVLRSNTLSKGANGGFYYLSLEGGSVIASGNVDENGTPIP